MYIGHLHSCFQDNRVLDYFNAILVRTDFETWDYCKKHNVDFRNCFYGQYSQRAKLRELIYPNIKYKHWLTIASQYSFVFLSANADTYPDSKDFSNYVKEMVNLFRPDVVGAMNECWEKRRNVDKFIQVVWDTAQGIKNSIKPNLPICMWNQKVRTLEEKEVYQKICKNDVLKSICKYVGIQSLETEPATLSWAINGARLEGFEAMDVEWGTKTSDFSTELFDIDRANQINKVFILTPYISTELANYDASFKGYALSIGNNKKDKFKIIDYVQQFKTEEEDMKIADEYKLLDKNDKVIDWIQAQLYYGGYLSKPVDFGNFDINTKSAVKDWQAANNLVITGIITKYHISLLIDQSKDPDKSFRQLVIYAS